MLDYFCSRCRYSYSLKHPQTYSLRGRSQRILESTTVEEYSYVYTGGSLMQMVLKTTTTPVDGEATTTTETLNFTYDASGTPLSVNFSGTDYYYVTNIQGDIMAILNTSGEPVVQYNYDAWGKLHSFFGSMEDTLGKVNPLTYRGYVYDRDTELYYLQSRYYDPEVGRFINADAGISTTGEAIIGNNLFAYCFNNPVNATDNSGNWPKWVSGVINIVSGTLQAAAGAVLGATVGWTGVGAVAAAALVANGAATATQGVGQIVNSVTKSNTLREDNIIRTGAQAVGGAVGGRTGAAIAGMAYDACIIAAAGYAASVKMPTPQSSFSTYNLNGSKDINYVNKRGWTDDMIDEAVFYGQRGSSVNMANGASCTAYQYPGLPNQYVVIENYSRNLVQASNIFDPGWIPDPRIIWYP